MPVVGKMRSGKGSRISVGGQNLNLAEFTVERRGDDLDTVNFECEGEDQGIIGILSTDISARGDWDAGANPVDSPPGIYPRDDLANVKFFTNTSDGVFWGFDFMRVLSARNSSQVRQKVA